LKTKGIEVEDAVFEKIRRFYAAAQNPDGGFPYYVRAAAGKVPDLHAKSEAGRTAGALWAMHLLGMQKSDAFPKAKAYLEARLEEVAGSQHGPGFHLFFAALAARAVDPALWKKFWLHYRDSILKGQTEDGSIALKPPEGANLPIDEGKGTLTLGAGGRIYATPLYALIFHLSDKHLLFPLLKPVPPPGK
jgi:hypothetical protein